MRQQVTLWSLRLCASNPIPTAANASKEPETTGVLSNDGYCPDLVCRPHQFASCCETMSKG